jgi:hypothetical protein
MISSLKTVNYKKTYFQSICGNEPASLNQCEVKKKLLIVASNFAEQILAQERNNIQLLVSILEDQHWPIFHNLILYLIHEFPSADCESLIAQLADSYNKDCEYVVLCKNYFAKLTQQEQENILYWIQTLYIDQYWIETQKLTVGLPNIVCENAEDKEVVGMEIPQTALDFDSMTIKQLVSALKTGEPIPSKTLDQWLGATLARLAENNPQHFAKSAEQFLSLSPVYLFYLLTGIRQGLKNQQGLEREIEEFDWSSILSFCSSLSTKFEQTNNSQANEISNDYLEIYREILDLLEFGLTDVQMGIPLQLREQVWYIIDLLITAINFISASNDGDDITNYQPKILVNIVVSYGLWLRRNFEQTSAGTTRLARGFDEMPEVRLVLDKYLHKDQNSALAIHSVYGQWFPWLALLDPQWTTQNIERIFPQEPTLNNLRLAAWESYINFSRVHDYAFDLLYAEYSYQVGQLNTNLQEKSKLTKSDQSLVQHLINLYWRGKLNLQPDGLLEQFFKLASDEMRGYGLELVGRSLYNSQHTIEPQVLNRLQLLWEQRLATAKSSDFPSAFVGELATFGWWFSSGKFDDGWAVSQFKQVFALVEKIEADFLVLERLSLIAEKMPESALECLKLMITQDKKGWGIYGWHEEIKNILHKALKSNKDGVKKTAKMLINGLGERGHWEFRDLLATVKD